MIIVVALVSLLLIYLALIASNTRKAAFDAPRLLAHRGLHGGAIPENSLAAFEAACAAGYGIELDVQITNDNVAVVFHDDTLSRMCGACGDIRELNYSDLLEMRLAGTVERIPTLHEVLRLVNGRVPLLVELKTNNRRYDLVQAALSELGKYNGDYIIESFDPLVLRQLRYANPDLIRGQLVERKHFPLSQLLLNFLSRPDFVACDKKMVNSVTVWIQSHIFRAPLAVWTVRNGNEFAQFDDCADMVVFEGFEP